MNLNLCNDPWLPFRLISGETATLPLKELGREDLREIVMPRQDFYGAAWQFLIGILQTAFAPRNEDEWLERYQNPPSMEDLTGALVRIEYAFNLLGEGPRFMQDLDALEDGTSVEIPNILLGSPSENALVQNKDLFSKRGKVRHLSLPIAAMALFCLQVNGQSGGSGHRTGLRGGGPLTTLLVSDDRNQTLFRKLWLNVVPLSHDSSLAPPEHFDDGVFPWLAPTRTSSDKGSEVYYTDDWVHPLQQYWAMPRRIRFKHPAKGTCDLSGQVDFCISSYKTKKHGINYEGSWSHPLTPYWFDPEKPDQRHEPFKGQPGGLGYRHWHQFLFSDNDKGRIPALVVSRLNANSEILEEELGLLDHLSVWVFGFDIDKGTVNSWHETRMPFLSIVPDVIPLFSQEVKDHVDIANDYRIALRGSCKHAWLGKGKSNGDLSFIDDQFWSATEADFYAMVDKLKTDIEGGRQTLNAEDCLIWIRNLKNKAMALFDALVLSDTSQTGHMGRKLEARRWLEWKKFDKAYLDKHRLNEKGAISV